jgi:hypothetical protein
MIIRLRLACLAVGVLAFAAALRLGIEWLRWVGIAAVAVALLLRFVKR